MVGVAVVRAKLRVRIKTVDFFTPPPEDVTVIGYAPAGVAPLVLIVNTVEQDKVQDTGEKEAEAPAGSPEAPNDTGCAVLESNAVLMVLVVEEPAVTTRSPELEIEKSKGRLTAICR